MKSVKFMLPAAAVLCGWLTIVNSAFAQTWTQTSAPNNEWWLVVSSADGTKLAALAGTNPNWVWTSTNSGMSWTSNTMPGGNSSSAFWYSFSSSADGSQLAAGELFSSPYNHTIYLSTNSGTDWTALTNGPHAPLVTCSADGTKLVAAGGPGWPPVFSPIYTSTNSGVTWMLTSAPIKNWSSLASSADGTKLVASVGGSAGPAPPPGGRIYTSTDSGNTWITNNVPFEDWICVASSADGNTLAAVADGGLICTSTNSGNTWTSNNVVPNEHWTSVAMSADGSKLAAVGYGPPGDLIYTSTNSGNTWTSNNVPNQHWTSVASSADGNEFVAAVYGGGIWISQSTPMPQLNIAPTNPNLKLSWIVPSTNFVLRQSSDLSSWTDVTDAPALNLTNLQDEVALSPTNSSGFYRLESR